MLAKVDYPTRWQKLRHENSFVERGGLKKAIILIGKVPSIVFHSSPLVQTMMLLRALVVGFNKVTIWFPLLSEGQSRPCSLVHTGQM